MPTTSSKKVVRVIVDAMILAIIFMTIYLILVL